MLQGKHTLAHTHVYKKKKSNRNLCVVFFVDKLTAGKSCAPASESSCAARSCTSWVSPLPGRARSSPQTPGSSATCSTTGTLATRGAPWCSASLRPSSGEAFGCHILCVRQLLRRQSRSSHCRCLRAGLDPLRSSSSLTSSQGAEAQAVAWMRSEAR